MNTGAALIVDGVAAVEFELAKRTGDFWPFVELICAVGTPLAGVHELEITYRCPKPLLLKLSQPDFGAAGNQTYAHYQFELPASPVEWRSARVRLADFTQPTWATAESRAIPLKLATVSDIYIVPDLDYTIGEKATVEVRSLVLFGLSHPADK